MQLSPAEDGTRRQRKGTMRRPGACGPCRESKTKCDGAMPCNACRSERRKSRTCHYSNKAKNAASLHERGLSVDLRRSHSSTPDSPKSKLRTGEAISHYVFGSVPGNVRIGNQFSSMYRRLALTDVIDEFLKVRPPRGSQTEHFGRIQNLTVDLRNHTYNLLELGTPRTDSDDDDMEYEHLGNPFGVNGVASAWKRRLRTLERWINNGELLRAWHDISSFQRAVQSHEVSSSYSLQADPGLVEAITSTYVRLLELDCMLGFFLGEQSLFPSWKRLKYLSTRIKEIEKKDPYYSTKLELFSGLHDILWIDLSNGAGVTEFLQYLHKIQTAEPALQLERIATCTLDEEPIKAQELKLFSNLLFMMLYCRTASVAEYYSQRTSQQARILQPVDRDRPSIVDDLRLTGFRSRSRECQQAVGHANFLLAAFERLCKVDSTATADCWFRLHGALIASVIVGVASIREKSVEHATGLKETLPRIRKCFQTLRRLNPLCAIFERAEAYFDEFDRIRQQAIEKSKPGPLLERRPSDSASEESISVPVSRRPSTTVGGDVFAPTTRRKRKIGEIETRAPLVKAKMRKPRGRPRKKQADDAEDIAAEEVNAIQTLISTQTNLQHDAYAYMNTTAIGGYPSYPPSANTSFADVGAQSSFTPAYSFDYPGPPFQLSPEFAIHPPMNLDAEVYDPSRYYLDPALQMNVLWHQPVMQNAGLMYAPTSILSHTPLHSHPSSSIQGSATALPTPSQVLSSPPAQPSGSSFFNVTAENFEPKRSHDTQMVTSRSSDPRPSSAQTLRDQMQEVAQTPYNFLAPQASPVEPGRPAAWRRPASSRQPSQIQGQQQFYAQNDAFDQSAITPFYRLPQHEAETMHTPTQRRGNIITISLKG